MTIQAPVRKTSRTVSLEELAHDEPLIEASRRGDRQAFEELYRRYYRPVRELCRMIVRDSGRVEDLTQETFLRAFQSMPRFKQGKSLWPWLATIARHLCVDEIRLRGKAPIVTDSIVDPDDEVDETIDLTADDVIARSERANLRRVLSAALALLRPADRRVLFLRSVEEWSYEDIARVDGRTVDAVRNVAWRSRITVRDALKGSGVPSLGVMPLALAALRGLGARVRARINHLLSTVPPGYVGGMAQHMTAACLAAISLALVVGAGTGRLPALSSELDRSSRDQGLQASSSPSEGAREGALGTTREAGEPPTSVRVGGEDGIGGPRSPLEFDFESDSPRDDGAAPPQDSHSYWIGFDPAQFGLAGERITLVKGGGGGSCDGGLNSVFPDEGPVQSVCGSPS